MESDNLVQIPEDIRPNVLEIIETIKKVANEEGKDSDEIKVISPSVKGFNEEEVIKAFILIGGSTLTWLTDKWLETYIWPIVKKKIDPKSKKAVKWLTQLIQNKRKK